MLPIYTAQSFSRISVTQLITKSPTRLSPYSHKTSTNPCPQPQESCQQRHITHLKFQFNIILPIRTNYHFRTFIRKHFIYVSSIPPAVHIPIKAM